MLFPHMLCERQGFSLPSLVNNSLNLRLAGIGWELITSSSYYWDGLKRKSKEGVVFQYTLSGEGVIRVGSREYLVPENSAFHCIVPGDHAYFFNETKEHWEILYMVMHGDDAIRHWSSLVKQLGPVIPFENQNEPIRVLSELYAELYNNNKQMDKYAVSTQLYRFIMEMYRIVEGKQLVVDDNDPSPVRNAIHFMQTQYALPISLEEIAERVGLSKHHFCRIFLQKTGLQPIQYLRKIRIEKASYLLSQTGKTVDTIAKETGFDSGNYFIRVFRTATGMTPNQYRITSKITLP